MRPKLETSACILIVDPDLEDQNLACAIVARAGYDTCVASSGREALRLLEEYRPDVVLLELALPDIWGLDLCTTIAETSDAYILLASAYVPDDMKLSALQLGADDVMSKPLFGEEVLARIATFLRRRDRGRRVAPPRLQVGDVALVRERQTLEHEDGTLSDLTALEFALLQCLADADGRLLTRAQILERVWNDVSGVETRVVDVHVAALRKKLLEVGSRLQIASVRGVGYRLDEG
ncbi:MAG TPA: response regulator transcription factor [Candidatus Baltobacteraceae bacterium]|nr:response regulator transcription factor [Candidatus Baltobacteraceae bacterium]